MRDRDIELASAGITRFDGPWYVRASRLMHQAIVIESHSRPVLTQFITRARTGIASQPTAKTAAIPLVSIIDHFSMRSPDL